MKSSFKMILIVSLAIFSGCSTNISYREPRRIIYVEEAPPTVVIVEQRPRRAIVRPRPIIISRHHRRCP